LQFEGFENLIPICKKRKEGKKENSLTEYQKFAREKRLEGKSFKEISKLWKKYKNQEGNQ
jgi:hypothetical protein